MENQSDILFQETTGDEKKRVSVTTILYANGLATISVVGKGSSSGMDAAAQSFEKAFSVLPETQKVRVFLDLNEFQGAPIHAQLSLVKWMITHQNRLRYIGILGGNTIAIQIAQAIQGWLPFGDRIGFYQQREDLIQTLERL